jgi:hypothetical protein
VEPAKGRVDVSDYKSLGLDRCPISPCQKMLGLEPNPVLGEEGCDHHRGDNG